MSIAPAWTPERLDMLRAAITSGPQKSAAVIANEMGVSRNVILGKINRLKKEGCDWIPESYGAPTITRDTLAGRPKHFVPQSQRPHNPLGNPKSVSKRIDQKRAEEVVRGLPLFDAEFRLPRSTAAPESLRIPFLDRCQIQCCYFDEDECDELTVCGHPTHEKTSYCAHHYGIVYMPSQRRGSAANTPRVQHVSSGLVDHDFRSSAPVQTISLAVEMPHRGRWSRTISEFRLRNKIAEDLEKQGSKQVVAAAAGLTPSALSKAIHETPTPANFAKLAAHYGYTRMPGETGMYVALPADSAEAA